MSTLEQQNYLAWFKSLTPEQKDRCMDDLLVRCARTDLWVGGFNAEITQTPVPLSDWLLDRFADCIGAAQKPPRETIKPTKL